MEQPKLQSEGSSNVELGNGLLHKVAKSDDLESRVKRLEGLCESRYRELAAAISDLNSKQLLLEKMA